MVFFGTNSALIAVELVGVNEMRRVVEVAESKETIRHADHYGQAETVSPELEEKLRTYFGLAPLYSSYRPEDPYASDTPEVRSFGPDERVDVEPGERARAQEESLLREPLEGVSPPGGTAEGESAENLSAAPQDRWDRQSTAGGVTVHRKRR